MRAITANFKERIVIAPEDVIPKSSWFKFVKCSLLTTLTLLLVIAIIMMLVAESLVKNHDKDSLTIGIISLVCLKHFIHFIKEKQLIRLNCRLALSYSCWESFR